MDILSMLSEVNYLAVLVATLASFVIGAAWYRQGTFGKQWMKGEGLTATDAQKGNMAKIMGLSALATFVSGVVMGMLFGGTGLENGIAMGALLGIGIVAMMLAMHHLYAQKPGYLYWINAGYDVILFIVMGAIIGAR